MQATDCATAQTLRVGTYNAWLIPVGAEDVRERMVRMPRALANQQLDILCFQEVWLPAYQSQLARALRAPFPYSVLSKGGLMVLSRYPIVSQRFHAFPHAEDLSPTEWIAGKGILETCVQTPQGRIRIVTTHMALDMTTLQKARRTQLRHLGRMVARWNDLPLIVTGDFNVPPTHNEQLSRDYRAVRAWGLIDARPVVRRADGTYKLPAPTRVGWPPHRRDCILFQWAVDYILYRNSPCHVPLTCLGHDLRLTGPCDALSDHHLVTAAFAWEGAQEHE